MTTWGQTGTSSRRWTRPSGSAAAGAHARHRSTAARTQSREEAPDGMLSAKGATPAGDESEAALAEPDGDDLKPFERGPEITEVR